MINSASKWIVYLRNDIDAWNDFLEWVKALKQTEMEKNPDTWDAEKERQGAKKTLDNILHLSSIDQKTDIQRKAYLGSVKHG